MRIMRIVNAIPQDHSNETNDDAEPSIAVNPGNIDEMVITAFTPVEGGNPNGPLFFSSDGGETWSLRFDIPGGETHDQSPFIVGVANELYIGTLRGDTGNLNVLRTNDPSTGTAALIEDRPPVDQPWVEAANVVGGSDDGKVRLYVGYNGSGAKSAKVDVCMDALAGTPTFNQVTLDARNPSPNDGYEIRPAAHPNGTVYVAYKSRSSFVGSNSVTDIVVARDNNWGAGGFTDLEDPDDGKAGCRVARDVPISESVDIGGIRLNNDLNIAVDPTNSGVVYIVWCDNSGPNYTLRVRKSEDSGRHWSGDLLTADTASMATMTINRRGMVGLLYQQLVAGRMETHFRTTNNGTDWDDTLLARTDTSPNFTGDYSRVVAVGSDFYGVFPAMNSPSPANFFPNGGGTFRFLRNTNGNQLRGLDGATVINQSVDPFFFKVQQRDCTVVTDRDTYSKDEVDALIHLQGSPAFIDDALFVIIDGFRGSDLNITAATLSGTPNVSPSINLTPGLTRMSFVASACTAEDPDHLNTPQRFTFAYRARFTGSDDFNAEVRTVTVTAPVVNNPGINLSGQAVITLTTQPNPYETDGPTSWLSVDLQVFEVIQNGSLPHTPSVVLNSGPNDFITRLLANTGGGYNDPSLPRAPNHPYDLDLVANQDTSTVSIAGSVGGIPPIFPGIPVFNFAVARVRYRALSTPAANVRAFFRLFQVSSTGTEFQPATTYLTGGTGGNKIPLLGVVNGEVVTIPCFAAPRVDPSGANGLNAQTDPINVGPVGESIPPDGSGNEVQVYFGCWLDINQTTPVLPAGGATGASPYVPVRSIQDAIRGQHQCLVAEIHLEPPAPQIATGRSPANSDKLAQRNLTIVGVASPHHVPVTFDIKPTPVQLAEGQVPDELMIDWGTVPEGSNASIYLPGTNADQIIAEADRLYPLHDLSKTDGETLTVKARGVTYVPIPKGIGSNYAGLLNVEVPESVKQGQRFKVIVRQLRNISAPRPAPPPPPPGITVHAAAIEAAVVVQRINWRHVVGAFQLTIPVQTKNALLVPEMRLLSVLRWIAERMAISDRWYPIFKRYLGIVEGRVTSLGGDPGTIQPSPSGDGGAKPHPPKGGERECHTGKISGLIYDRFGDFEGFILHTEDYERQYFSREKDMAVLAERAWRERLRITVCAERHAPRQAATIIIHEPPVPFHG